MIGDAMSIGSGHADGAACFIAELAKMQAPKVVEIGTLRWGLEPTHHQTWAPHAAEYIMTDVSDGTDVDVVSDAHDLSPFGTGSIDALICVSVLEHLARPWVAAAAMRRIVKPGGLIYVATHQTFPLHGYPHDYFRFSTAAMEILFGEPQWTVLHCGYLYPAAIIPPEEVTRWNTAAPAWLNVEITARAEPLQKKTARSRQVI